MLQALSADGAATTTSSCTERKVEVPIYSTLVSEVMNTSFELCSISRSLKQHGKSKQKQVLKLPAKF